MDLHYVFYLQILLLKHLTITVKHLFLMYFVSQDAVNVLDVLHKHQNEENADDDYEIVDMDYGDHEDVNSDSEQDYVNVDQDDSEQDYVNVETDDSEQDYVNVSITENRSMLDNNYEDMKVIL